MDEKEVLVVDNVLVIDNGWIMCESGIYPAGIPDEDPEETYEEAVEVLIVVAGKFSSGMFLAYYYPDEEYECLGSTGIHKAHWENEHKRWPLEDVVCWRHKPALPPCMEE